MIRLIKWLITGDSHLHKWKTVRKIELLTYSKYECQCEECGEFKFFNGY